MSTNEIISRINRIYASVGAVVEGDLTRFPPTLTERGNLGGSTLSPTLRGRSRAW